MRSIVALGSSTKGSADNFESATISSKIISPVSLGLISLPSDFAATGYFADQPAMIHRIVVLPESAAVGAAGAGVPEHHLAHVYDQTQ